MKRTEKIKAIVLSMLCAICCILCCIGYFAASEISATAEELTYTTDMYCDGASIRLADDGKSGIRFHVRVNATSDKSVTLNGVTYDQTAFNALTKGILVIPQDLLGENELSIAGATIGYTANGKTVKAANVTDSSWYFKSETTDGETNYYYEATAYVYNIPESSYEKDFAFRGYYVADGEYIYSQDTQSRALSYVAVRAKQDLESGNYETEFEDILNGYLPNTLTTVFENTDKYLYRVGNKNTVALSSLFSVDTTRGYDLDLAVKDLKLTIDGTEQSVSNLSSTIQFSGTGLTEVEIWDAYSRPCILLLEVVDGKNVTAASELTGNSNNVLLSDITLTTGFELSGKTLFGNGYMMDVTGCTATNGYGLVKLSNATFDNVKVIGDVYTTFNDTNNTEYYAAAVYASGTSLISNCYISGCQNALRIGDNGSVTVENTTLYGGRYANIQLKWGTLTLKDVTTVQEKVTADGTTCLGFGIVVWQDAPTGTQIKVEGGLMQYNWVCKADKDYLPKDAASYVDTAFGYTQFVYNYDGTDYINLGIISISSNVLSDSIDVPDGYSAQEVQVLGSNACVVTCDNSKAKNLLENGIPTYADWSATTQGAYKPTFTWTYPNDYLDQSNTIQATFEQGDSYTLDPNFLEAKKHGESLEVFVTMDDVDYTGKCITFTESGAHMLTYTVIDPYNYDATGNKSNVLYTFTINVTATEKAPDSKNAEFTYTDGSAVKIVEINGKKYVMPDVSATGDTIASTTVNGTTVYMPIVSAIYKDNSSDFNGYAPLFTAINITDYAGGVPTGAATTYNTSTKTLPSGWGKSSGSPYINGAASTTADPVTYSSYGLCYESLKGANISEHTQIVCFYYTDNAGETYYYYIQYKFEAHTCPSCVTGDTLITLADGTQKRVDELTGEEEFLVWNLETGELDSAAIMFIDSEAGRECEVIRLIFSDGTEVKVISEHGFWDYDLNKYVYLDRYAAQYIGHSFAKQTGKDLTAIQLVDVVLETVYENAYSPVTVGHLCYFVNGMLSMPGGVGGLFNIFEVDAETMSYDTEALQRDIEIYGLFTYEELNAIVPLSREMFESAGGQYLKISIGKGNLTMYELINMINRYSKFI